VLAHELAHEILHQAAGKRAATLKRPGPARTKAEKETEADATAYVVLAVLGLPSKAPSYIAWQGGTGSAVLRSMTRIQRAAKAILEAAGTEEDGWPG
jgi:antirestriction protein ArdC